MEEKMYVVKYEMTVSAKNEDAAELAAWVLVVRDEARAFVKEVTQ